MKMHQKKYIITLIFLMISILMFTQIALNREDKIISSNKCAVIVNTAQLTEISQIKISKNSDWDALSGNSWFQGSGTFPDPYLISNITINTDGDMNPDKYCISISNTDLYFIIQNCALSLRTYGWSGVEIAGIYLQNVEKGLIYNNEFHNNYDASCIRLFDCYNVSIVKNNAFEGGFLIMDSETINVSNNVITNAFSGISLARSSNCSIWRNEIRLTEEYPGYDYQNYGIWLTDSDFNTITENHFYCIPNNFEIYGSNIGNVIENNYFYSCVFYDPKIVLTTELLISSVSMFGIIIPLFVIAFKYPRRKKLVGRISTAITLGIMGLLAHGAYTFLLIAGYSFFYLMALVPLIGVNLALLILSVRLIRKSSSHS